MGKARSSSALLCPPGRGRGEHCSAVLLGERPGVRDGGRGERQEKRKGKERLLYGQKIRSAPVRAGWGRRGRWKATTAAEDTACIRAGATLRAGSPELSEQGSAQRRPARPPPGLWPCRWCRFQAGIHSCLSVSPRGAPECRRSWEAAGVEFQPAELVSRRWRRAAAGGRGRLRACRAGPGLACVGLTASVGGRLRAQPDDAAPSPRVVVAPHTAKPPPVGTAPGPRCGLPPPAACSSPADKPVAQ